MSIHPQIIEQPELDLSVVIPIFNEKGNIDKLYHELTQA